MCLTVLNSEGTSTGSNKNWSSSIFMKGDTREEGDVKRATEEE